MTHRPPSLAMRAGSARSLADEAVDAGASVFDSTREFAAQALERAADTMRDLRYGVVDTANAAQRRVGRYADVTSRWVADQPLKSALIAATVGALVMAAILLSRRRPHRF